MSKVAARSLTEMAGRRERFRFRSRKNTVPHMLTRVAKEEDYASWGSLENK